MYPAGQLKCVNMKSHDIVKLIVLQFSFFHNFDQSIILLIMDFIG